MSDQEQTTIVPEGTIYPKTWMIQPDWDPNEHLMDLKGRAYLNVQNRLLWFIKEQREFIAAGLGQVPYRIQTDLVEMDRQAGFAHFKTYVRDVLGNESTAYGSEAVKDFPDYAEKAGTKSLGRALLGLGYGTANAQEMDEGERVVDSPVERKRPTPPPKSTPPTPPPSRAPQPAASSSTGSSATYRAPATTGPAARSGAVSANTRKKLREWAEQKTDFMREMKSQRYPEMKGSLADELTEQEALALLMALPTLEQQWRAAKQPPVETRSFATPAPPKAEPKVEAEPAEPEDNSPTDPDEEPCRAPRDSEDPAKIPTKGDLDYVMEVAGALFKDEDHKRSVLWAMRQGVKFYAPQEGKRIRDTWTTDDCEKAIAMLEDWNLEQSPAENLKRLGVAPVPPQRSAPVAKAS